MRLDLEYFVAQLRCSLAVIFQLSKLSGNFSGGATPVPISNTEVKSSSADDTAWFSVWERRSLPDFMPLNLQLVQGRFSLNKLKNIYKKIILN